MSMDVVGQPLMEDEYIEMESACANVEAKTDHTRPGAGHGMYMYNKMYVCTVVFMLTFKDHNAI